MLTAVVSSPLVFKIICVLIGPWRDPEDCSALANTGFVCDRSFFRDSPADQCPDEAARETTGTRTCETRCDGTPYDKAETR